MITALKDVSCLGPICGRSESTSSISHPSASSRRFNVFELLNYLNYTS